MLNNQHYASKLKTIAITHNPPIKISAPLTEVLQLGFTYAKKIDLYHIGDKKPCSATSSSHEPDDLDLSALTLESVNTLDSEMVEYSAEQMRDVYKFTQLGLLFSLCEDAPRLVPGLNKATDELILARLHNALSHNITNPNEVVQEFIHFWNDIATLSIAAVNLGTKPASQGEKTVFTYHENYRSTVLRFAIQLSAIDVQSKLFKTCLSKIAYLKGPGDHTESLNLLETQVYFTSIQRRVTMFLAPTSLDLISAADQKQLHKTVELLTTPYKPSTSTTSEYTPYRSRRRELDLSKDDTRRDRSKSPNRGEESEIPDTSCCSCSRNIRF